MRRSSPSEHPFPPCSPCCSSPVADRAESRERDFAPDAPRTSQMVRPPRGCGSTCVWRWGRSVPYLLPVLHPPAGAGGPHPPASARITGRLSGGVGRSRSFSTAPARHGAVQEPGRPGDGAGAPAATSGGADCVVSYGVSGGGSGGAGGGGGVGGIGATGPGPTESGSAWGAGFGCGIRLPKRVIHTAPRPTVMAR